MIVWCDDFGSYGTTPSLMLDGPYAEVGPDSNLFTDPDDDAIASIVFGNSIGTGDATMLRWVLPEPTETLGVALRLWCSPLPASANEGAGPIVFCDGDNAVQIGLRVATTGALQVIRNGWTSGGTVIADSNSPVIIANAWNHIEMKATIDSSAGEVRVKVNGVTVIDEDSLNTRGTAGPEIEQLRICQDRTGGGFGPATYYKDFVVWDTTGAQNNDFLGLVRCIRLPVDGDVTLGDWAPSEGSEGWPLLDESPPIDTDFIQADVGDDDPAIMEFQNLPPDITRVYALRTYVRAQNSDGGIGKLQTSLVSDGVDDPGVDRQITVAPTYWSDISELDPDTGLAWTPASTDLARIKFDRTE